MAVSRSMSQPDLKEAMGPFEAIAMLVMPALGARAAIGGIVGRLAARRAAASGGGEVARIFSGRVLRRMTDDVFHDFPQHMADDVFAGTRTVVSDDYVLYTRRGVANGRSGTYEIGVRPSESGRTEVITHWFFNPDK